MTATLNNAGPTPTEREQLIRQVMSDLDLNKGEAEKTVKTVFSNLVSLIRDKATEAGSEVRIHELGTFRIQGVAARDRVNPKTGEVGPVPARTRVTLKLTKGLRDLGKAVAV